MPAHGSAAGARRIHPITAIVAIAATPMLPAVIAIRRRRARSGSYEIASISSAIDGQRASAAGESARRMIASRNFGTGPPAGGGVMRPWRIASASAGPVPENGRTWYSASQSATPNEN